MSEAEIVREANRQIRNAIDGLNEEMKHSGIQAFAHYPKEVTITFQCDSDDSGKKKKGPPLPPPREPERRW